MKVLIDPGFGRHGWDVFDIPEAKTLGEAAYLAIRKHLMPDLKDDEFTYKIEMNKHFSWAGKEVYYNSVKFYRTEKSEELYPYNGPKALETDYWFSFTFKEHEDVV